MSILRVANLQFNASGTRRIDYDAVADDGIVKITAAAIKLPVGDTASRPTSQAGIVRYNSDTGYMEFGGATSWVPVASNVAFDVANAAFTMANVAYNAQNVDYTLSNTAFSVANAAFGFSNTVNTFAYGVAVNAAAAFSAANNVGPQIAPAFNKANNALANTSGTFAGNLSVIGNVGIGTATPSTYGLFSAVSSSNTFFAVATDAYTSFQVGIRPANDTYCTVHYNYGTFASGNFWNNDYWSGGMNWTLFAAGTNVGTKLTLSSSGTLSPSGPLAPTGTPGTYSIDVTTGSSAVTVANGGTVDFPNCSGMLIVNNWMNGAVTIYLCGAGSTATVASVVGQVGTFGYVAGIAGYRWTSNYAGTGIYGFCFIRTRNTA